MIDAKAIELSQPGRAPSSASVLPGRTGTIDHLEAALAQNRSIAELLARFDEIGLSERQPPSA